MNELIRTNLTKRKNSKKGFTLVELIVVLVILAILAAILIPAMTGWMKKADNKSAVIETRTMKVALQTIVSENYKTLKVDTATGDIKIVDNTQVVNQAGDKVSLKVAAQELAETGTDATKGMPSRVQVDGSNVVTKFTYVTQDGKNTVVYDASQEGEAAFKVTPIK